MWVMEAFKAFNAGCYDVEKY